MMPRAKKFRVRRNLTLTKEADVLLEQRSKETGDELSKVVSDALTLYCLMEENDRFIARNSIAANGGVDKLNSILTARPSRASLGPSQRRQKLRDSR